MGIGSPSPDEVEGVAPHAGEPPAQPPGAGDATPHEPVKLLVRSPLVAAVLSFLFPGAGQLYMGHRTAAAAFALPTLAIIAWAVLQLSNGPVYFALSMLDDGYALTVMVVAACLTAWRLVAIAQPFVVARPLHLGARSGAVLALLVVATLGMGDVAFSNALDVYNADRQIAANDFHEPDASAVAVASPSPTPYQPWITYVPAGSGYLDSPSPAAPTPTPFVCEDYPVKAAFVPGGIAAAAPAVKSAVGPVALVPAADPNPTPSGTGSDGTTAPPEATPSPTTSIGPTTEATPSPTQSPSSGSTGSTASGGPSPSPSASPAPTPNPDRMTVLLTGVDFLQGRHHALNDTIILVSIDLKTHSVSMVSVPRDTANFPFYWGGQASSSFKINTLVDAISAGRFGSPDSPMVTLANEVGYLVGVKVNYYAEVDIDGFAKMIDAIGGVDIYNPSLLNDPFTCTYVPAGNVHLDATNALRYVRSRETSSDYYRSSRQQRVLIALEKKIARPTTLPKLGSLLALAGRSIATNFPLNTAKDYWSVAENLASISQCVLGPPYNYHPDPTLTNGAWTRRLLLDRVANLSVSLFGTDSRYYGQPGVTPTSCQSRF